MPQEPAIDSGRAVLIWSLQLPLNIPATILQAGQQDCCDCGKSAEDTDKDAKAKAIHTDLSEDLKGCSDGSDYHDGTLS